MRTSIFILLLAFVVSMALTTTGCASKSEEKDSVIDSVKPAPLPVDTSKFAEVDSLVKATPMPKQADELFDDFFFNFYINDKLQSNRITFPLKVVTGDQTLQVQRNDWKMDHFFRYEEFYSVIAPTAKGLKCANDTTIKHVTVENMQFGTGHVKQYEFNRVDGKWMMQQINTVSIGNHPDAQFLEFLYKFATDEEYQRTSLSPTITYVGPDPESEDETKNVTKNISSEAWGEVVHVFPDNFEENVNKTGMFSITYGDRQPSANQRVVSFRGIANGNELRYTFKRVGTAWKLAKYEM